MAKLNNLEEAALEAICNQRPGERLFLEEQLANATVVRRRNTGAGFFTYFDVDRLTTSRIPISEGTQVLGDVLAEVNGFKAGLRLTLFIKDGYLNFLEGATAGIVDITTEVDFDHVDFKILCD